MLSPYISLPRLLIRDLSGTYSLTGGHLEHGETFEQGAKREVKEECVMCKTQKVCQSHGHSWARLRTPNAFHEMC